jgi:hypothetical protein
MSQKEILIFFIIRISNNKKGMLTATIEQKVFSLHQTSSIAVLHIHNDSEPVLNHFAKDLTRRLQQKSQLQDQIILCQQQ